MKTKGKFFVLDGSEGAGKSELLKRLVAEFGDQIVATREPGGTPYAEEIRDIILKSPNAAQADGKTLSALFWASRADHMKNKIIPALLEGKVVISDRFDSSTFAYQIFGQGATELKDNFFVFRDFFVGDYVPDLYVYLDVKIETGLARKKKDGDSDLNHLDQKEIDFYERMKIGFKEFFEKVPSVTIDANQEIDAVYEDLVSALGLRQ